MSAASSPVRVGIALLCWVFGACDSAAIAAEQMGMAAAQENMAQGCADLAPSSPVTVGAKRALKPDDLVRLRDIGRPDGSLRTESPIGLSPDGRRVAFQIRRADPQRNDYCLGIFVLELRVGAGPRLIDSGGTMIRDSYADLWGTAGWPTGVPTVIQPRWSPDGRWVAFLKRTDSVTQVWRARTDGGGSEPVTSATDDVETFDWSHDGTAVIFATRPGLRSGREEIDREGRSGFHFDDRFQPLSGSRPMPRAPVPLVAFRVGLLDRVSVRATPEEARQIGAAPDPAAIAGAIMIASRGAARAWSAARDPTLYLSPTFLSASLGEGKRATCRSAECEAIVGLWWSRTERDVYFLNRTGWGRSRLGLYRWQPGTAQPRLILETADLLIGCQIADDKLICLQEGSALPRRMVSVDLRSGRVQPLLDPNPEFASIALGTVERLQWRNDRGIECFGDLVVPPDHKPGQAHPLIVVQYLSRGFLRGGTGDEYPIQAFAARGYAVLSVERPPEIGGLSGAHDQIEFERANIADWADRKSVVSALLKGVDLALARGVADRDRIGLTGLSDGVSTVMHALIQSEIFSAVAISQCCDDPQVQLNYAGSQFSDFLEQVGYPGVDEERPAFWAPRSLALNAERIRAPILIQVDDDEYRSALETFASFRRHGKPIDMYVYPDETHIKWQPAHRLAVYRRNLDWFDFWLRGVRQPDPARQAELDRWQAMGRSCGPGAAVACQQKVMWSGTQEN
ncbi:MAG: Atxe2 family lasso peptide isopeptidase [Gammaproteobacteria bacterium]